MLNSQDVELADLDGDGDLDAFIANARQTPDKYNTVWLNDGNGNFTDSGQRLGNRQSLGVALGDLDRDGDVDAFVANQDTWANIVWLNDGTGTFSLGLQMRDTDSRGVALGDFDEDGDLDAFVANFPSNEVWTNDGNGNFTNSGQSLAPNTWAVPVGDLDGDGDLDAFTVSNGELGNQVVWLNQNSEGVPQDPPPTQLTLPDGGGTFEVVVDAGDLVVRRQGGAQFFRHPLGDVTELTVNGTNDPEEIIVNLTGGIPVAGFALTINGDGADDAVTLVGVDPAFDGTIAVNGQTDNDILDASTMTKGVTLNGGAGNDTLTGSSAADHLIGNADNDRLNGQAGADKLMGGGGADGLSGMDGDDYLDGGNGSDTILGGDRDDTLSGQDGDDIALGEGGVDSVDGGNDNDTVAGGGNGIATRKLIIRFCFIIRYS